MSFTVSTTILFFYHTVITMFAALPVVLGLIASVSARCGTPKPSDEMKALHATYRANEISSAGNRVLRDSAGYVIDTYIHIITAGSSQADGYVSEAQMNKQVNIRFYIPTFLVCPVLERQLMSSDECPKRRV